MSTNGSSPGGERAHLGPRAFWLQPGVVAAVAALAIGVGFVSDARSDGLSSRDVFVASMIGGAVVTGFAGTAAVGSTVELLRARGVLLAWTSGSLVGVGSLSLSSFGLPLLIAGFVAVPGWLSTFEQRASRRAVWIVAASLIAALSTVVVGVLLTR